MWALGEDEGKCDVCLPKETDNDAPNLAAQAAEVAF